MLRQAGYLLVILSAAFLKQAPANELPWQSLPSTPRLPHGGRGGYVETDGAKLWYSDFGRGDPVLLLHGGLANSNYWGNQVATLANKYRVIVLDTRGHGRSTRDNRAFSYELLAADVVAVLDALKISEVSIVGWSDGAIVGLMIALKHPDRLRRLFAFGANSDPDGVQDPSGSKVFAEYLIRTKTEYEELSSTPLAYERLATDIAKMWSTQPSFTADQLRSIRVPVWIVDGDHDEAIKRANTEFMASSIPLSGLLIQPDVSHFSFLQNPKSFSADVLHFLHAR
jgi:pimeloyl-ACP methyl ester carboxylesterase